MVTTLNYKYEFVKEAVEAFPEPPGYALYKIVHAIKATEDDIENSILLGPQHYHPDGYKAVAHFYKEFQSFIIDVGYPDYHMERTRILRGFSGTFENKGVERAYDLLSGDSRFTDDHLIDLICSDLALTKHKDNPFFIRDCYYKRILPFGVINFDIEQDDIVFELHPNMLPQPGNKKEDH